MGCGASKEDIAAFEAMRQRCDELELDRAELEQTIITMEKELKNNDIKNKEQLNLYRFKIEVMTNMLSVEEKKLESTVKRLETLKLAMLTQGFSDKTMNNLLRNGGKSVPGNTNTTGSGSGSGSTGLSADEQSILMTSELDLGGAIARLTEEMTKRAEDVIYAFANKQGKLLSHISRDDFCRYLYNATETLSKPDVQILALRFFDGSTVSVPEFIDFFTSSSSTRVARAAASAVRVSLNMLQLEVSDVKKSNNKTKDENVALVDNPSTNMKNLQKSVDKLLSLWDKVEESLIDEFAGIEEEIGGNQIVQFDTFEDVLDTFCGPKRVIEERKHRRPTHHKWLTMEDINFIACRFEIGDRIDVKQFFNFFQDAYYSTDSQPNASATPFQFSKEWSTLKQSAQQDLVALKKPVVVYDEPEDDDEESQFDEEKSIEPEPKPVPKKSVIKPKPSKSPTKDQPNPKPALVKAKSERKEVKAAEPKKPLKTKSSAPLKIERKEKVQAPPEKVFNNTLVALYASDPDSFENKLEAMSSRTGFIMTKDEFKVLLQDHTADDNIEESEIDDVLSHLKYIAGTCSVTDLVEYLTQSVETAKPAPPVEEKTKGAKKSSSPDDVVHGPFVNIRQQHIIDTIEELKVAKLDTISAQHEADPKAFLTTLKVSSINNKTGVVDGTGNSITSASFNQVMRDLVPKATKKEVKTLELELQPSIRKLTSDIPLSAITNKLKARTKEFKATASNITKQEKLLAIEEKRNVSMEERATKIKELTLQQEQTDSIVDHYFMDPTLFMAKLKSGKDPKTISMADLLQYVDTEVPKVTRAEGKKFKTDILESNKKLNAQDPNVQVPYAAAEKILKQRNAAKVKLLKQIETEKKLLQKDVDKASTIDDSGGGCCGGGGKNVHDPNNAPQELPKDFASNASKKSGNNVAKPTDSDDYDDDEPEFPRDRRSTDDFSRADDEPLSDEEVDEEKEGGVDDDDDEDLPRYNPSSIKGRVKPRLKNSQTTDTLTFSDCEDDNKSDDSGRLNGAQEKLMHRKPMARAARGGSRGGSNREFGKPRAMDDGRGVPSDVSDDDSLLFQSMKK